MKKLFEEERGFTLLEVLISMTILSVVVIGMMSFFENSYSYVKENESKTVATQVARNVMNYVEKQDFSKMEGYLIYERIPLENKYILELDFTHCIQPVTISTKSLPSVTERTNIDNVLLFDDQARCQSILKPTINNVTYDGDKKVQIYIMKYNNTEEILRLKVLIEQNNHVINELPDGIKEFILNYDEDLDKFKPSEFSEKEFMDEHLLRVFTVLNWNEDREEVMIQGVLSHETIR
ncbi:MAG: type IV pilus modification PilV family protein [Bacillota bacterium]